MLEKIKSKGSLAAVVTLAFAAMVTFGVADTHAVGTATSTITGVNASGSGSSNSSSSNSSSSNSSTSSTSTAESTIPDTSAGTTTNPDTADDTWLYAFASLAITATAIGGRRYFAKH